MLDMGVQDSDIFKSFGLFGLAGALIVLGLIIHRAIKCLKQKTGLAHKARLALEKKLCHSGWLKYLIVSNLKLNYTIWAFLLAKGGFETVSQGVLTIVQLLLLTVLIIFPPFIMIFLTKHKDDLDRPSFKKKWDTLYNGFEID